MDLSFLKKTHKELKVYASENGIKFNSNLSRINLIKAILKSKFESMTVSDLADYSRINGIAIPAKARKAEIIDVLIEGTTSLNNRTFFTVPGRTSIFEDTGDGDFVFNICLICLKCGEQIHAFRRTKTKNVDLKAQNKLIKMISKCPNCGKEINLDEISHIEFNDNSNLDDIFKSINKTNSSRFKERSLENTSRYEDACTSSGIKTKSELIIDSVNSSVEKLKQYIMCLIHLETEIYYIEERLSVLYLMGIDNAQSLYRAEKQLSLVLDNEFANQTSCIVDDIERIKDEMERPPKELMIEECICDEKLFASFGISKPEFDELEAPVKPIKPVFSVPKYPKEPFYEKPGLFNRKRIVADNEAKKLAYEREIEKFNRINGEYELAKKKYNVEMIRYKEEKVLYNEYVKQQKTRIRDYENRCKEARKKAEEQARIEAINKWTQENTPILEARLKEKKSEYEKQKKNFKLYRTEKYSLLPQLKISALISSEEKNLRDELKKIVKTRNELLSYDIIYKKYRNQVALTMLYEYLDSGRCDSLDGVHGAYNLYESEIRANTIISQLNSVLTSLESIREKQSVLYCELRAVNTDLKDINESMLCAVSEITQLNSSLEDTKLYLSEIDKNIDSLQVTNKSILETSKITAATSVVTATNTSEIATNSEMQAYFSAVTAHYAKVNAELTNALGFMMA